MKKATQIITAKATLFFQGMGQKWKDKTGLSHQMEILIAILIVIVIGAILMNAFKTNVPELIQILFDKVKNLFN